jgi:hypothetical protein
MKAPPLPAKKCPCSINLIHFENSLLSVLKMFGQAGGGLGGFGLQLQTQNTGFQQPTGTGNPPFKPVQVLVVLFFNFFVSEVFLRFLIALPKVRDKMLIF